MLPTQERFLQIFFSKARCHQEDLTITSDALFFMHQQKIHDKNHKNNVSPLLNYFSMWLVGGGGGPWGSCPTCPMVNPALNIADSVPGWHSQGMTLRPCLVYLPCIFEPPLSPSWHIKFSFHMLISKDNLYPGHSTEPVRSSACKLRHFVFHGSIDHEEHGKFLSNTRACPPSVDLLFDQQTPPLQQELRQLLR